MRYTEPPEFEFYAYTFKDERGHNGGVASRRGLCAISFANQKAATVKKKLKACLENRDGKIKWVTDLKDIDDEDARFILEKFQRELDLYFHGKLKRFSLPIEIGSGNEFERKVWMNLERIPYGTTVNYKYIAEKLGDAKSAKLIGSACGNNPLPIIIPCHRVLAGKKKLGGFPGGVTRQKMLLKIEGALPSPKN